jgi:hypothetical protein
MDLNIFKKREPSDVEHFWALVIGRNWVQSAIWRVVGDKAEVVSEGSSVTWEEDNEESLVVAADSSLSSAAANITDEVSEPNKVVFGLPTSWINDGNISDDRLGLLKKVSKELELSPAGFVVLPEAIAHFLKSREGAPLNAILVGPSDASIDVTVVQNGKILGSVEVAKSMSTADDVAEGLAQIEKISQYPSRILLYNHKHGNLEDARRQLLDAEWKDSKISFMHTPKVDILPEDIGISAVSLAGGAEVGHATGVILPTDAGSLNMADDVEEDLPDENLPDASDVEEVSPEELGFLEGVDVAEVNELRGLSETPKSEPVIAPPVQSPRTAVADDAFEPVPHVAPIGKRNPLSGIFASVGGILSSIKLPSGIKLPKIGGMRIGGHAGNFGGIALVTVLALLILGGLAYWYLPRATVTIFVSPKLLEKTINIKVDSSITSADVSNHIVPGQMKEVAVTGDKTTSATGTKTIGESAKGGVTILHAGPATTLKAGTVLTGPSKLKFTLDSDVAIASGSTSLSNFNPSKTSATVTASDIGPDYNLSSGSKFTVGNFSDNDFSAQNDQAFSGGTARSITAVSEEDRANLKKSLMSELTSRGLDQLKAQLGADEILVDDSSTFTTDSENYNSKVGDEASTVKLSLSGKVRALVVPKSAMNDLVKSEIQQEVPQGFLLREDQIDISYKAIAAKPASKSDKSKDTKTTSSTTSNFEATIKANLLPQVKPDEIASKITGKLPDEARSYLATIPGFSRAEIDINFRLPGSLGTLPRISKNITVEVSAER